MKIAILNLENDATNASSNTLSLGEATRLFSLAGHDILASFTANSNLAIPHILASIYDLKPQAIIAIGNLESFLVALRKDNPNINNIPLFELRGICYAINKTLSLDFINTVAIPALNSKEKKTSTVLVYRTFGESLEKLQLLLTPYITNKAKIKFTFFKISHLEYEIHIRYFNNAPIGVVEETKRETVMLLKPYLYAMKSVALNELVIELLVARGKTLSIAESFTGGALAAKLIEVSGASIVIKEGIVSYSNQSKLNRLKVDSKIINNYGDVSIEVAYEMAAMLIAQSETDFVLATTGYASDPPQNAKGKNTTKGIFFIAVGDSKDLHIFKHFLENATRSEIISHGVTLALYSLYKKLIGPKFDEIVAKL
ncbi:MAG: CinA family protein [Firmicutes bacterium]|nr:CinA family protein [Bacillota bacterium]